MKVDTNIWGVVISLDHSEVAAGDPTKVVKALGGAGGVLAAVLAAAHVAAGQIGLIVGIVEAAITATWAGITAADKGNGTYCTIPWPTIFALGPIIVPTTRPPVTAGPPANWATSPNGTFGTDDPADNIAYSIQHGGTSPIFIQFTLKLSPLSSGWWKGVQLASGVQIQATGKDGSGSSAELAGLYSNPNTRIIFSKAKEFGLHQPVLRLPGLDQLKTGDLVVFTWMRD